MPADVSPAAGRPPGSGGGAPRLIRAVSGCPPQPSQLPWFPQLGTSVRHLLYRAKRRIEIARTMTKCPQWCVADHDAEDEPGHVLHRGTTHTVAVVLEGRGTDGPQAGELLVEISRRHDEAAIWVYLGDGWSGFSLSLESASRLEEALSSTLRAAGTLDPTGL